MGDPDRYRAYAEDCRRLANIMDKENRDTLLRIAEAWARLAEEAERQKPPPDE